MTVVFDDGPLWTSAPARRAARMASRRGLLRMPVNVRCTPLSVRSTPTLSARRRVAQRVDQLVGALVALAALAEAAIDDLLEVIAAREEPHVRRADARPRVALDQHAQQLADLIDVVARLPLRRGSGQDVARRRQRVHRPRGDAAAIALLLHDAEVAELELPAVADEDVQRRQVAMEQLAAVQLAEHLEDAGDLAPGRRLRPAARPWRRRYALRSPKRAYSSARQ